MTYLSISPDIHVWRNNLIALFYDVRRHKQFSFPLDIDKDAHLLVDKIRDIRNLYCIPLSDNQIDSPFVLKLVDSNIGSIVSQPSDNPPTQIPPFHLLANRFIEGKDINSGYILDFVREISIHLESGCRYNCANCYRLYKQTCFCTKEVGCLNEETLFRLAKNALSLNNLRKINLIISEVNPSRLNAIRSLALENTLSCIYINEKNISIEIVELLLRANDSALIKVLVEISAISNDHMENIFKMQARFYRSMILVFCIACSKDLTRLNSYLDQTESPNIEIIYIYTGKEMRHIHDGYLLNNQDLCEITVNHNSIFGNQELNFSLFGKFIIHPDGSIRLNENTAAIGCIDDDWTEILNMALNKPNPWLMTRNKIKPCLNCVYQDLCPPIRNLELSIGNYLACTDYYKTLSSLDSNAMPLEK